MVSKYAELGSVSSGTMICEDVFDACISTLNYLDKARAEAIQKEWDDVESECPNKSEHVEGQDCDNCEEQRSYILNETLWDALDEYAPPYCYFGAHPGDGADYGFWVREDIEQLVEDGELLKVNDLAEVPSDHTGEVLQVSDHGNLTLYVRDEHGEFQDVWSV